MSFTQSDMNAVQAKMNCAQAASLSGSTVPRNPTEAHWWAGNLMQHFANAAKKYGPDILADADAFFATDTGKKAAGWLEAKAEDAGIPPEFVTHAGPEVRALLTKIEAWNSAPGGVAQRDPGT
jgi:hypothetical protein